MTPTTEIMLKVHRLPPEKQQQVLEYVESLLDNSQEAEPKPPLKSPRGLWKNRVPDMSEEEIDELRREMWSEYMQPEK